MGRMDSGPFAGLAPVEATTSEEDLQALEAATAAREAQISPSEVGLVAEEATGEAGKEDAKPEGEADAAAGPSAEETEEARPPVRPIEVEAEDWEEPETPKISGAEKMGVIWLLAMGCRGDVAPLIPMSLHLMKAGFQILVWTPLAFMRLFTAHNIPVKGVDELLLKRNEATRAFFRNKASAYSDGDRSADDLEEIFLHMMFMKVEYLHHQAMVMTATHQFERTPKIQELEEKMEELAWESFDYEQVWSIHQEAVDEYNRTEADRVGMTVPDLVTIRDRYRRSLLEELKRRAAAVGVMPTDYLHCIHAYVKGYMGLMMDAVRVGHATMQNVLTTFADFFSWARGLPPAQYFNGWENRLPPSLPLQEADILGVKATAKNRLHVKNLLLELEGSPEADRPKLVLANHAARVISAYITEKTGVPVVPLFTEPHSLHHDFLWLMFRIGVQDEGSIRLESTPFQDRGPVQFVEDVSDFEKHILATEPTMLHAAFMPPSLQRDEQWQETWKANTLGTFVLDARKQLQCEHADVYGDAACRQRLQEFLPAGPTPVCIAWGTRIYKDPLEFMVLLLQSLRLAGQRGIIITRWSRITPQLLEGLTEEDQEYLRTKCLLLKAAPYSWLFPRCSCVVTYGGRGVVHNAFRCGVPLIFINDADEGPRGPMLAAFHMHGSVKKHPEAYLSATPQKLAQTISEVLGDEGLRSKAEEVRKEALKSPRVGPFLERVKKLLETPREEASEATSLENRCPWCDGTYDVFMGDGQCIGRVHIAGGKGETGDGLAMWFKHGNFKKVPRPNPAMPWLPPPTEEESYNVEVYYDNFVTAGVVSEDGMTWLLEDQTRLVYRPTLPKACQCVIG